MGEYEGSREPYSMHRSSTPSGSGTIARIRLENFMCHTHLQIDFCPFVNFITGQNGSGKSAILTALCIAFGCRAKGTQRALSLKEFIKKGCGYAVVEVEVKNYGEDAFKYPTYGDAIIIERRITESSNSLFLKDHRGRKVATKRDELRELVEHFNIDVENPCVVMSQDKSREFLHSGSEKDKFKFFFKATLLQRVKDLLQNINIQLESANSLVDDLVSSIKPIEKELSELQEKIKNLELIEDLTVQVQQLKKKLAWAWVYDVDKQLSTQVQKVSSLKDRIPVCQAKIDRETSEVESLSKRLIKNKSHISEMVDKTQEVKRKQTELQKCISLAKKEKNEIELRNRLHSSELEKMVKRLTLLKQQAVDTHDQNIRNTQAEVFEIEERIKELQLLVNEAADQQLRWEEEEKVAVEKISKQQSEIKKIMEEIDDLRKKERETKQAIRDLRSHRTNKVTAFGGPRVIQLLQSIERHQKSFSASPIGPIGAHLADENDNLDASDELQNFHLVLSNFQTLTDGDKWATAVENATGKLLDAFIVTNHADSVLLRKCAKEAQYDQLQIVIYDFARPRLNIPSHLLPQTNHPSTFTVLCSDNTTVMNVLVDMGNAERQVLVENYESGKLVAFDKRIPNVKEVFTMDGYRMFFRGSVQTVLPPNKKLKLGRLSSSYENQIEALEIELSNVEKELDECTKKKNLLDSELQKMVSQKKTIMENRVKSERELSKLKLSLDEKRKSYEAEVTSTSDSNVDDINQEISTLEENIKEQETEAEKLKSQLTETDEKLKQLKDSFESIDESAREEIVGLEEAESSLVKTERDLKEAQKKKAHYEDVMNRRVLQDIKQAEEQLEELQKTRQDSCNKASIICPESEIHALGEWDGSTPEKLSALLTRLNQRLRSENQTCPHSIEELRSMYNKKESKIAKRRETHRTFQEKLCACRDALNVRLRKFDRNAALLKRELTCGFNSHLGKKGISGNIKIDYDEQTLKVEVKMPQDASNSNVRDTKGLSGGERSFSTLCFALALHQMIESPFRAMDEFDVFMDAVSRKISLDTVVDYALTQGSQWIFITPHDISMVKNDAKIKKQEMAPPRS